MSRAVLFVLAAALSMTAAVPDAEATRYPTGNGPKSVVRPRAFYPAGHGIGFSQATWSRWGKRRAVGRARLHVYDVNSDYEEYSRTRVILDRAQGGLFRRVRWRYRDGSAGLSTYSFGRWVIQWASSSSSSPRVLTETPHVRLHVRTFWGDKRITSVPAG